MDTVEDDTEYLKENPEAKHELLRTFYQKIRDPNFHLENCGGTLQATAHYADLMLHFDHVCKIFLNLDQKYQAVIEDVTMKMGCGMVDYLGMTGVDTIKDYDEYCLKLVLFVGQMDLPYSFRVLLSGQQQTLRTTFAHLPNSLFP